MTDGAIGINFIRSCYEIFIFIFIFLRCVASGYEFYEFHFMLYIEVLGNFYGICISFFYRSFVDIYNDETDIIFVGTIRDR